MNSIFLPNALPPAAVTVPEFTHHIESIFIEANGLRFHALAAGPADGSLILLLHGFPQSSHTWRSQLLALAAAGHRAVAPDQRGYGQSSKPAGIHAYTLDKLAADVVAIAKALKRQRIGVVGHDWGGVVAWHLGACHADTIARVSILNAPHPGVFSRYALRHPSQLLKSAYMAFFQLPWLPERLLRARNFAWLHHCLTGTSHADAFSADDLQTYQCAWTQPGALTAMLNWYRAMRCRPKPSTGDVTIPLQMIWGRHDPFLQVGLADESILRAPQGRLMYLPDATHWLLHEQPRPINALLIDFFAGLPDTSKP